MSLKSCDFATFAAHASTSSAWISTVVPQSGTPGGGGARRSSDGSASRPNRPRAHRPIPTRSVPGGLRYTVVSRSIHPARRGRRRSVGPNGSPQCRPTRRQWPRWRVFRCPVTGGLPLLVTMRWRAVPGRCARRRARWRRWRCGRCDRRRGRTRPRALGAVHRRRRRDLCSTRRCWLTCG